MLFSVEKKLNIIIFRIYIHYLSYERTKSNI